MSVVLAASVLGAATAIIVLVLVLTGRRRNDSKDEVTHALRPGHPAGPGRRWPCPLCGALLGPGQRIRSVVRLSPKHGRIMEISGCPQCLPPASRLRTCPVCKAELTTTDVLSANVFDRSTENVKLHVHILGCNKCRGR